MAYVAVDKSGQEVELPREPIRNVDNYWYNKVDGSGQEYYGNDLESGSIEKLIGKKLTWEDEPVELKDDDVK